MLNLIERKLGDLRLNRWFNSAFDQFTLLQSSQSILPLKVGVPQKFVLVPCDPWTLIGSKGDEAMICAVVSQLKAVNPSVKVLVFSATSQASAAAQSLGFECLEIWDKGPAAMMDAAMSFEADCLAVLGADCMDGHYSPITTLNMLAVADLAARSGIRTSVLGFSFNDHPYPGLRKVFDAMHERVRIHVRDGVSFDRFRKFTKVRSLLVADAAFQLVPDEDCAAISRLREWVDSQRDVGREVIGFNVHPMLLGKPSEEELNRLVDKVSMALSAYMEARSVSLVLISHDYRKDVGDDVCLAPLWGRLRAKFADRVHYDTTMCSAAQLKAKAGLMSGVVTGRMHLAIASLGMGVPVAALTYQDKFQGLMKHVGLPFDLLLSPVELENPQNLSSMLLRFHDGLLSFRAQVNMTLPEVKRASAQNVAPLIDG